MKLYSTDECLRFRGNVERLSDMNEHFDFFILGDYFTELYDFLNIASPQAYSGLCHLSGWDLYPT